MDTSDTNEFVSVLLLITAVSRPGSAASCQTPSPTTAFCSGDTSMTAVPDSFDPAITFLWLDDTGIAAISNTSFVNYTQLQYITIFNSQLTTIAVDTFENLTQLVYVDLSGNQLTGVVDISWVCYIDSLQTIIIQESTIHTMTASCPPDLGPLPVSVTTLDLIGQPLSCCCNLGWLQSSDINITASARKNSNVIAVCAGTPTAAGKPLVAVPPSER